MDIRYTRLTDGRRERYNRFDQAMDLQGRETWLWVSPHDDDLCIGGGMWMQAAVAAGVDVQVLVVTDGRMGYCRLDQRPHIAEIRRAEAIKSFGILGVPEKNVAYIGYPDGALSTYQGRRPAAVGEANIEGYVGLQNAFTYHLRRARPTRVIVPTFTDLHPDHQVTHNELMICLFHSAGAIWPELGPVLAKVPAVYEMAIYCDFVQPPNLELRGDAKLFETKLASIAAYQSQEQIAMTVEGIRQAGPYEYLREVNFRFYSPANYRGLFD